MHIYDVADRYILIGREPPLVDDQILHLIIPVDRFYLLKGISSIQNTLYHAHDDNGQEDADNRHLHPKEIASQNAKTATPKRAVNVKRL